MTSGLRCLSFYAPSDIYGKTASKNTVENTIDRIEERCGSLNQVQPGRSDNNLSSGSDLAYLNHVHEIDSSHGYRSLTVANGNAMIALPTGVWMLVPLTQRRVQHA